MSSAQPRPSSARPRPSVCRRASLWAAAALSVVGCAPEGEEAPELATQRAPIAAYCTAQVNGRGVVDVEETYLPAVVSCENGAASDAALRAQAVAARSYLYYKLATSGSIADGTSDQVYTCNRPPSERHRQAVRDTRGEVLTNSAGNVIAAFYVAGAIPSTSTCRPLSSDRDPTNTEKWVTYNEGRSGGNVTPTPLGHPGNPLNRGCKSQNGANCLGNHGKNYKQILRFYYGEDIGIVRATGTCTTLPPDAGVPPPLDAAIPQDAARPVDAARPPDAALPIDAAPAPDAAPPADRGVASDQGSAGEGDQCVPPLAQAQHAVVIDEQSTCFIPQCEGRDLWRSHGLGEGGSALSLPAQAGPASECRGRWRFGVAQSGVYALSVSLPNAAPPASRQATYRVSHARGESHVTLDQSASFGWVSLGQFNFRAGSQAWVELSDLTGEAPDDEGPFVIFDALSIDWVGPSAGGPDDEWDDTSDDPQPQPPSDLDGGPPPTEQDLDGAQLSGGCASAPGAAPASFAQPPALLLAGGLLLWWRRRRSRGRATTR